MVECHVRPHSYRVCDNRGLASARNGTALGIVSPFASDMSRSLGFIWSGSDQSNACKTVATVNCTKMLPMCMPGQILRPDPKGRNSKSWPWLFMCEYLLPSMNLSGRNFRGSSHTFGSLPMAYTFTTIRLFAGMSYPEALHAWMDSWGRSKGTGGCRRNVSLQMHWMYLRCGRSDSCTNRLRPTTASSSSSAFFTIDGSRNNSDIAHSVVNNDVSVAAMNAFCNMKYCHNEKHKRSFCLCHSCVVGWLLSLS